MLHSFHRRFHGNIYLLCQIEAMQAFCVSIYQYVWGFVNSLFAFSALEVVHYDFRPHCLYLLNFHFADRGHSKWKVTAWWWFCFILLPVSWQKSHAAYFLLVQIHYMLHFPKLLIRLPLVLCLPCISYCGWLVESLVGFSIYVHGCIYVDHLSICTCYFWNCDHLKCRYVGNIHKKVTVTLLAEVFATIGPLSGCKLIKRNKVSTNISRMVHLIWAQRYP